MRKQNNVFNYIHVLFIGICILTVLAFSIQYSLKRERIQKNMDKSVDLMVKGVQENLLSMDKLYIALEMYADTRLKQAINQMNDAYERGELTQEEIERIQADYDHVNLYVINSDNIIVASL